MSFRKTYGLLGDLIKRHGMAATRRGLTHLACAAILVKATGEEPTVLAMAEYWNESERTTYRGLSAWRKIAGDQDLGETARLVVSTYSASMLDEGSVPALAFDLVDFVPAQ